jgi:hypothetical protein
MRRSSSGLDALDVIGFYRRALKVFVTPYLDSLFVDYKLL